MIFGDFPTKSSLSVFNFWEAENFFFLVLLFQGPYGAQLIRGKITGQYFQKTNKMSWSGPPGGQQAAQEPGWRAHPPTARHQVSWGPRASSGVHLYMGGSVSRKNLRHIFFPRFLEAAVEAKVLSYSGRGQILLLWGRRRRGNPSHHHRHSS